MLEFRINTEIGKKKKKITFSVLLMLFTNTKCEKVMDSKGISIPKESSQHIK